MQAPTRFPLGDATISVLHMGDLRVRLADWLRLAEAVWPQEYRTLFAEPITVPVQCVHIALPGRSMLVDVCHPQLLGHVGETAAGDAPVSSLLDQFAAIGADPAAVDTLVITHPHFDHYCGAIAVGATPADDQLLFPNARHLVGRADWDALQDALQSPASPVSRALGLADRHGLVDAVEGLHNLGDGISIVPTPGETPGHQAVRVESLGQVLYVLGDLYHHPVEVERPEWGVHWADAAAIAKSREALATAALAEGALLVAAHIPGAGRLCTTPSGLRWDHTRPA